MGSKDPKRSIDPIDLKFINYRYSTNHRQSLRSSFRRILEGSEIPVVEDFLELLVAHHPGVKARTVARLTEKYYRAGILPFSLTPHQAYRYLHEMAREGRILEEEGRGQSPHHFWPLRKKGRAIALNTL